MKSIARRSLSDDNNPSLLSQELSENKVPDTPRTKMMKRERIWFCCKNGRTDSRMVQYITTTMFAFIILFFSIFQLIRLTTPEAQNTYISLITLLFGIFMPRPKVTK